MDFKNYRFYYFAHSTLRVPRVARQCIVGLCEGAAEAGVETELIAVNHKMNPNEPAHPDLKELYDINFDFKIKEYYIPFINIDRENAWFRLSRIFYYSIFIIKTFLIGKFKNDKINIVSGRNYSVLITAIFLKNILRLKYKVIADIHGMPDTNYKIKVLNKCDGIMAISGYLANELINLIGAKRGKISFGHTGIKSIPNNSPNPQSSILRDKINLPNEKKIIVYTGKVYYKYEEIEYLVRLASALKDNIFLLIVGGRPDHVRKWIQYTKSQNIENILFISFVQPTEVKYYLELADYLILYYSDSKLNNYRSPAKLFQYMASGKPVIAADFKGTSEIIKDGYNGFLVPPYDEEKLIEKVKSILDSKLNMDELTNNALRTLGDYTFRKRAEKFFELANKI